MITFDQTTFEQVDFTEHDLHVHRRNNADRASILVVFVHGYNGSGNSAWEKFPHFLFNSNEKAPRDIAIFDYYSGFRRAWRLRPTIEQSANALAKHLVGLSKSYSDIILIAHSMGGLIAKDAFRCFVGMTETGSTSTSQISGLIMFGTPNRGARLGQKIIRGFGREVADLRRNSSYIEGLEDFFFSRVETKNSVAPINRKFLLPVFAGVGDRDWVVSRRSAKANVYEDQVSVFRCGHIKLVKPIRSTSPQVEWANRAIDVILEVKNNRRIDPSRRVAEQSKTPRSKADGLVLTELAVESDGHEFRQVYREAIASSSTAEVTVTDNRYPAERATDLLVSVHRCADVSSMRDSTIEGLRAATDRHLRGVPTVSIIAAHAPPNASAQTDIFDAMVRFSKSATVANTGSSGVYIQIASSAHEVAAIIVSHVDHIVNGLMDHKNYLDRLSDVDDLMVGPKYLVNRSLIEGV